MSPATANGNRARVLVAGSAIFGSQDYAGTIRAMRAEIKRLRREALERDVLEAEAEIAAGDLPSFDSADALIAYLHRDDPECKYRRRGVLSVTCASCPANDGPP